MELNLIEQASLLDKFGILPRQLRSFYHFIIFNWTNIKNNSTSLFRQILVLKKTIIIASSNLTYRSLTQTISNIHLLL